MKHYDDATPGMIIYTARSHDFWDRNSENSSGRSDGTLSKHTKMKITEIENGLLCFEVMEGRFAGRQHAVLWWGDGNANPRDYLTEDEYQLAQKVDEVSERQGYQPSIAIPPGETIQEVLEDLKMPLDAFALAMEMDKGAATALMDGSRRITQNIAEKLQQVLEIPASFWMRLEFLYSDTLKLLYEKEQREEGEVKP